MLEYGVVSEGNGNWFTLTEASEIQKSYAYLLLNWDEEQDRLWAFLAAFSSLHGCNHHVTIELHTTLQLFVLYQPSFKKDFTALWGCRLGIVKLVHYFHLKMQRWYSRQWSPFTTGQWRHQPLLTILTIGLTILLWPTGFQTRGVFPPCNLYIELRMTMTIVIIFQLRLGLHYHFDPIQLIQPQLSPHRVRMWTIGIKMIGLLETHLWPRRYEPGELCTNHSGYEGQGSSCS